MKRYIIGLLCLVVLMGCSSSSDDSETSPPPTPENEAPSVPVLKAPVDNLNCTDSQLDLSWNASTDPEGDPITYSVQLATNSTFSENLQVSTTSSTTVNFSLLKGFAYYWHINAKDDKNKVSDYSSTWEFYSEGEGVSNHVPYAAALVSPLKNEELSNLEISLNWEGSDADKETLNYDVYFGNTNPPALVAENITETSYDVSLEATTTYYWKIDSKDNSEGEAVGQIWSFSTK